MAASAGKTYVTKGYSTYTNMPLPQDGYDHRSNQYLVETIKQRLPTPHTLVGSPSKIELLKEYVHAPSLSKTQKYANPDHYEGYEPNLVINYESSIPPNHHGQDAFMKAHNQSSWPVKSGNFSNPEKYHPSSLAHGYPSKEAHLINSGLRWEGTGNFSSPNKSWMSTGPPTTHHPLTTPTNNINEALGLLEESVNRSPRSDQRRKGILDDLSTRAQPIEPQRRYARPAFVAKPNDTRSNFTNIGNTINSHEGVRRYHGTHIP